MTKIDIEKFKNIIEIPLTAEPNYTFDVFLEDDNYNIEFRTFGSETRISIWLNDFVLCSYGSINIYEFNLTLFSKFQKGAFFFLKNKTIKETKNLNFLDFGKGKIRLFYGSF